jgi:hypothetical protein
MNVGTEFGAAPEIGGEETPNSNLQAPEKFQTSNPKRGRSHAAKMRHRWRAEAGSWQADFPVPEGHPKIAQGFNLGFWCRKRQSPEGTAEISVAKMVFSEVLFTWRRIGRLWSLKFGASLELGIWNLEFWR